MTEFRSTSQTPGERYRREARRIRSVHRGCVGRMHGRLREAAERCDREIKNPQAYVGVEGARGFAAVVERAIEQGVLTYSRRLQLIASAKRFGIGRFEANLVIAAVQHSKASESGVAPAKRDFPVAAAMLGAALSVQLIILALGWWVFGA